MVLLCAGFTVYALSTRRADLWIFISFPLLYIWFMTVRPMQVPRWAYPLVPFVAIGGAAALSWVVRILVAGSGSWTLPWARMGRFAAASAALVALGPPLWMGATSFSRRITPPTHALAEAWIRDHSAPGTVILLGRGWLRLGDTHLTTRRVPDLKTVLDRGVRQLGGCDWILVPEGLLRHPTLRQLTLLQRFDADRSLGGNLGYSYGVYAVPETVTGTECGG
jgi:hypothetical protein